MGHTLKGIAWSVERSSLAETGSLKEMTLTAADSSDVSLIVFVAGTGQ